MRQHGYWVILLMLILSHTAFASERSPAKALAPPNVVLMLSDDTNWFDIGAYDGVYDFTPKNTKTPNIDQLAKQGMMFTSAFTATAACAPSRQQLYTGLFPVRSGAYPQHSIAYSDTKSAAHYFKDLGYRVGKAGKQHEGPRQVYPFEKIGMPNMKGSQGLASFDLEKVDEFINRDRQQPFFLIIASHSSHGPHNRGDASLFDANTLNVPPFMVDTPKTRERLVNYYAEVSDLDIEVGYVNALLDRASVTNNTIFIFTSEQGFHYPYAKYTLYDTGVKTAFIIRWPEHIAKNTQSDAIIQYVDVVPTLIDAAGGKVPSTLDGKSFLPVLEQTSQYHHQYAFGVHTNRNVAWANDYPIRSIRDNRYKLILNLMPENSFISPQNNPNAPSTKGGWAMLLDWQKAADNGDGWAKKRVQNFNQRPQREFYDMHADPYELNNLAGDEQYAKIIEDMTLDLIAWMDHQGDLGVKTELAACSRKAPFKETCP